jgi:hypothetical protein
VPAVWRRRNFRMMPNNIHDGIFFGWSISSKITVRARRASIIWCTNCEERERQPLICIHGTFKARLVPIRCFSEREGNVKKERIVSHAASSASALFRCVFFYWSICRCRARLISSANERRPLSRHERRVQNCSRGARMISSLFLICRCTAAAAARCRAGAAASLRVIGRMQISFVRVIHLH